jgi:hypothetical protein
VLGGVSRWVATNDLVSAELWEAAQPLLPPEPCTTHGGPPRVPHRSALAGILYVLRHGLRWRDQGGCSNIAQLYRELIALGYQGSRSLVYNALVPWRPSRPAPDPITGRRPRGWPRIKRDQRALVVPASS